MAKKKVVNSFQAPSGILRHLCYIVSFLVPLAGFVLGSVYFSQNDDENRKFGKYCLIITGVSIVLFIILMILMMAAGSMFEGSMMPALNIEEGYY